jgi:hypothetical protein
MALRICSTIPFRFSFFATALKHSGHNACKLTGRLSFNDPLICSNWGCIRALNFTEHFWHRWCALSNTVCLMLIVRCSYLLLSTFSPGEPPKNDNTQYYMLSNLFLTVLPQNNPWNSITMNSTRIIGRYTKFTEFFWIDVSNS